MKEMDEKRAALHAAIDREESEEVLNSVQKVLDEKIVYATQEEEEAIAAGIADIEAGRYITLDQFMENSAREREERRKRAEGRA